MIIHKDTVIMTAEELEYDRVMIVRLAVDSLKKEMAEAPIKREEARKYLGIGETAFINFLYQAKNPIPHHGSSKMMRFYRHELKEWLSTIK